MLDSMFKLQTIAIVDIILQEEFDTQKDAVAKYGQSILVVKESGEVEYNLELKRHYKPDWSVVKAGDKKVPIKEFYAYVKA